MERGRTGVSQEHGARGKGRGEEESVSVSRDAEEQGEESWRGGRILMGSACVLPSDLPAAET